MTERNDIPLRDNDPILVASAGPQEFRVSYPWARLSVSGSGTLESWDGTTWDAGIAFTASSTITSPGRYRITLDAPGNATVQETRQG